MNTDIIMLDLGHLLLKHRFITTHILVWIILAGLLVLKKYIPFYWKHVEEIFKNDFFV